MGSFQLSVVHRLPQSYRWSSGEEGYGVEPILVPTEQENEALVGLKLLSHQGGEAWQIMQRLSQYLTEIQVSSSVVEWEQEPCLFVSPNDEGTVLCHLKNVGVAIAEKVTAHFPF